MSETVKAIAFKCSRCGQVVLVNCLVFHKGKFVLIADCDCGEQTHFDVEKMSAQLLDYRYVNHKGLVN